MILFSSNVQSRRTEMITEEETQNVQKKVFLQGEKSYFLFVIIIGLLLFVHVFHIEL